MSKTVIALSIVALSVVGFLAFDAAAMAQQPSTTPDPKMPPMPSMEAPDSNDMTKPAGPIKPTPAAKTKTSGKPASTAMMKRAASGGGRMAKSPLAAKRVVAAGHKVMMKARPARIAHPALRSTSKAKRR